jgi:hypothetical protein
VEYESNQSLSVQTPTTDRPEESEARKARS